MEERATRRLVAQRRRQVLGDFEWLAEREDEKGFRRYLTALGLAEGSERYEMAFEAWRERLRENRSRMRRL